MTLADFLLARIAEDEAMATVDDFRFSYLGHQTVAERLLAECEAKRQLIERVGNPAWAGFRILAAVNADHPDYRDEWRP